MCCLPHWLSGVWLAFDLFGVGASEAAVGCLGGCPEVRTWLHLGFFAPGELVDAAAALRLAAFAGLAFFSSTIFGNLLLGSFMRALAISAGMALTWSMVVLAKLRNAAM